MKDDRVRGLLFIAAMAAVMWVVEAINAVDGYRLDAGGIRPRDADGLDGVLFAPFLHASWGHLIGNTIPFLVLGAVIALSGLARVAAVTVVVGVVAGIGTWLVAPSNTLHVGASGIVFGYAAYLVALGLWTRRPLHLVAGALVALVWGATLVSSLVPRDGISWQGHLFGAIGGVIAARIVTQRSSVASMRP